MGPRGKVDTGTTGPREHPIPAKIHTQLRLIKGILVIFPLGNLLIQLLSPI